MKYESVKTLKVEEFCRLTGVKPTTFDRMVLILKDTELRKKAHGGKPNKLCIEDRLLNDFRIFERIPYLFSYSHQLWNFRKRLPKEY